MYETIYRVKHEVEFEEDFIAYFTDFKEAKAFFDKAVDSVKDDYQYMKMANAYGEQTWLYIGMVHDWTLDEGGWLTDKLNGETEYILHSYPICSHFSSYNEFEKFIRNSQRKANDSILKLSL